MAILAVLMEKNKILSEQPIGTDHGSANLAAEVQVLTARQSAKRETTGQSSEVYIPCPTLWRPVTNRL